MSRRAIQRALARDDLGVHAATNDDDTEENSGTDDNVGGLSSRRVANAFLLVWVMFFPPFSASHGC